MSSISHSSSGTTTMWWRKTLPNILSWTILGMMLLANPAVGMISIIDEVSNATLATINDLPARFIPERFSFYGIQGYVILADPENACTKVKPPPERNPPDLEYPINWILLARRSPECHFQKKIENAQNAGYTAIIIHNVDSNSTEIMGVEDPSKIIIYATFVGSYDGELLKSHTYGTACFVRIQDDFSINGYLLPFAIVVGLCFIVMIIFMLWQQVLRWIRERRRSRRRKLPASALKKIPTQKWTKGDPYETCAVCLDDFVEQDKIRVLPCAHGFHMKCIDPWLTKGRRVCPICKRKVIVADEQFNRGGDSDTDTDDESAPLLGTSSSPGSTAAGTSGEETFIQQQEGQGESSEQSEAGHSSSSSPSSSHHHAHDSSSSPQNLPLVHTRGASRGVFSLLHSRLQRSASATAPPPAAATTTTTTTTARPRPRPPHSPLGMMISSSDSSPSITSNRTSPGSSPSTRHPHHHSVLAEVHHSTEILRQKKAELDHRGGVEDEDDDDDVEILVVTTGEGDEEKNEEASAGQENNFVVTIPSSSPPPPTSGNNWTHDFSSREEDESGVGHLTTREEDDDPIA
ncbi:E3 ubiquitin-protein ligase RNF13 isoform X2 [Folsomia candida]|uniref:E3 ubiquitin-protein ligase RNF13 isoform X2 n=1 Tax=Folsomia candida TaxID=158441 RepID=UPI000B8FA0EF|nr:E3 ubiquitin-protein ligase RNF13 isoform X2 [Folsomia candida]